MIVFRKSKKKILSFISIILGTSFIFAPINYLFEKTNNLIVSNSNFSQSKDVRTNNDDVKLSYDNRNSDNESPNGVVNILEDELVFTSWFNQEVWRYNPKGSDENNTIIRQFFGKDNLNSLNGLRVKYNVYNDTFLIYGTINKGGLYAFIIQVDANTGKEIIVNEKANNSLWASRQIGEIGHIILNEANGSMIILPKFSKFSKGANTLIGRCDSSTYTPIWSRFSSLSLNNNFVYNSNNDIPQAFYIDEDVWGFIYFIKGNETISDKYKYLFFNNKLDFIGKSNEIQIGSENKTSGNSSAIIGKPLIFPFYSQQTNTQYRIIDSIITPVYTENNYNNKFILGSDQLKFHTLIPIQNGVTTPTFSTTNQSLSGYVTYQIKKDEKNNVFYVSCFEKSNNVVNFSKNKIIGFKIDSSNGEVTKLPAELIDTYTGQKVVTNISIINDKLNKNLKTSLIKEVKNYGKGMNSSLTNKPQITTLTQTRYKIAKTDTKISEGVSWTKLTKDEYLLNVNESIKQKLASDVLENDILDLVKYKNGNTIASYVENELEEINVEDEYSLTGTKKVLYNNELGKIKSRVKSNIKKWWYEDNDTSINSSLTDYTDVELTGFYTINDLVFKLVTSSGVDETKWTKIQNNYIGKVLPSTITKNDILNDFISKGERIDLQESDINISNGDINSFSNKKETRKPIEIIFSDRSGSLSITYDLKSKSSISMEQTNVVGSYSYIGFLNSSSNVPIKLNKEKFDELKLSKLSNQFTKKDLLNILEASNLYDTKDLEKWELTYKYDSNSNEYKNGLLNGNADFTFKYKKPQDFPSHIKDSNFTINVTSSSKKIDDQGELLNGNNCLTLSDYIFNNNVPTIATFNQEEANLLTGIKELNDIKNNIDLFLVQTLNITNGIFKVDQIKAKFDEKSSSNKRAIFDLSFKNENIISEINVVKKDGSSEEKLIFDKYIKDEINKKKENYFNLPKISFNYSLLEFNWNYELESNSNNNFLEIEFDEMLRKVNEDRINSNKNPFNFSKRFLPSEFVNYFKEKEKEFNNHFPLIVDKKIKNNLNLKNSLNVIDPSYYEISKIQMIANDDNGTINIRYEIVYPNLSTINQVYVNPEVKLTGLKSKSTSTTLMVILISVFSIFIALLIISIPLIILMKHHRFLNSNLGKKEKRNKLKSRYIKKVTNK